MHQPSPKMHFVKGNGKKKPANAIDKIYRKLDITSKKMIVNEATLAKSGECIEQNIDQLHTKIRQSMTATKA
jgi:hypothetical protein